MFKFLETVFDRKQICDRSEPKTGAQTVTLGSLFTIHHPLTGSVGQSTPGECPKAMITSAFSGRSGQFQVR